MGPIPGFSDSLDTYIFSFKLPRPINICSTHSLSQIKSLIHFSMIGTLTFPSGTSLKFSPENFRFHRKMSFTFNRTSICASVAAASPPAVDTRRKPGNLYEVLRVKQNASQMEIKTAYRTLAKIYHPDVAAAEAKHPEESFDGCDFIEIHKAYSTLSDPAARAIYDLTLSIGTQPRPLGVSYSATGGFRRHSGFYTTRRWETDQCW